MSLSSWVNKAWSGADFWDKDENKKQKQQFAQQAQQQQQQQARQPQQPGQPRQVNQQQQLPTAGAPRRTNVTDVISTLNTPKPQIAPPIQPAPPTLQQQVNKSYGSGLSGIGNRLRDVVDANTQADNIRRTARSGLNENFDQQQQRLTQQAINTKSTANSANQFSAAGLKNIVDRVGKAPGSIAQLQGRNAKAINKIDNPFLRTGAKLVAAPFGGLMSDSQADKNLSFGKNINSIVDNKLQQSSLGDRQGHNKWVRGAGQVTTDLPLQLATGGLGLVNIGAQTASDEANKAQAAGRSNESALGIGYLQGGASALSEKIGIDRFLPGKSNVTGNTLVKALKSVLTEGAQEGQQQFTQNLIANKTYDPNQSLKEGVLESVVLGGLAGGGTSLALDTPNIANKLRQSNQTQQAPTKTGLPHTGEVAILSDYQESLLGKLPLSLTNQTHAAARNIAQQYGLDVTSGSPYEINNRINNFIENGMPQAPAQSGLLDRARTRFDDFLESRTDHRFDNLPEGKVYNALTGKVMDAPNPKTGGYIAGPLALDFSKAKADGKVFDGVDGKPRFEVSDEGAKLNLQDSPSGRKSFYTTDQLKSGKDATLSQVLDHPKLYEQYPGLKDLRIQSIDFYKDARSQAAYDSSTKTLNVSNELLNNPKELKEAILHEVQHSIQDIEGFAKGGSIQGEDVAGYNNLAGEAEARAVQARMNMPMSERYVKPEPLYHGTGKDFKQFGLNAETKQARADIAKLNTERSKLVESGKVVDNALTIPPQAQKRIAQIDKEIESIYQRPNIMPSNVKEKGVYLTSDKNYAETFAGKEGKILETQADVKNPYVIESKDEMDLIEDAAYYPDIIKNLESQGYDGIKAPDGQVLVFDPSKVSIGKPQPRSTFYDSLDVPKKDLIIRNGDGKAMYAKPKTNRGNFNEQVVNPQGAIPAPVKPIATEKRTTKTPLAVPQIDQRTTEASSLPDNRPKSQFAQRVATDKKLSTDLRKNVKENAPTYDPTSDQTHINESDKFVSEKGISKAASDVSSRLDIKKSGANDQTVSDAIAVIKELDRVGGEANLQRSTDITEKLSERLTAAGQSIQAASLLSNRTPAGLRYGAIKTLKNAGVELTPEVQTKVDKAIQAVKDTKTGTYENDLARFKVLETVSKLVPASRASKLVQLWKAGLLSAPSTTAGNLMANTLEQGTKRFYEDPIATGADILMSAFTGKRSKSLTAKGVVSGAGEGAAKGVRYFKTGYDPRNPNSKFDVKNVHYSDTKLGRAAEAYTQSIFKLMGSQDQPFYYASMRNSLYDQAITEAKNQGLKGQARKDFVKKFVTEPSKKSMELADSEAKYDVFQNKTKLGQIATGAKGKAGAAGDFFIPFSGVPSSIATRIVERTPAGTAMEVVKQMKSGNFDQRRMAQAIARGTTGIVLVGVGKALSELPDMLTLGYPKDDEERKLWELEGKQAYSVKVGGKWRSLNYFQPAGTLIAAGGEYAAAKKDGASESEAWSRAVASAGKALTEQSFLKGVSGTLNAINDPARAGSQFLEQTVGSVVPNFIRSTARSFDNVQRQSNGAIDSIKAGIPGVRQTLAPKVDAFGNDSPRRSSAINGFINPTKPSDVRQTDDTTKELRRLQDAGQGIMTPNVTKNSLGGDTKLTPAQITDIQKKIYPEIKSTWDTLTKDPRYAELDDEGKMKALRSAKESIFNARKAEYSATNSVGKFAPDYQGKETKLNAKERQVLNGSGADFFAKAGKKTYAQKYEDALKDLNDTNNGYSSVEKAKKQKSLRILAVQKDYDNDTVMLYGMSKDSVLDLVSNDPNGKAIYEKALAYGDALVKAGLTKKNKLRTGGKGGGKGKSKGKGGGGKKGNSAAGVSSLLAMMKAGAAIKPPTTPKAPAIQAKKPTAVKLKKYAGAKSGKVSAPKISSRKGIKYA